MRRNIEKHILLNGDEAEDLKKKAIQACLSEAGLLRLLLKGYEPREKPRKEFCDALSELNTIGNNLNQLVAKAHKLNFIDAPELEKQMQTWAEFQSRIEEDYLVPLESRLKWQ